MLDEIIKILIVFLLFDEIKKRFNLNFRLNDFILLDDIESDIDFNKENANKIIDTENYINYDNIVTTDKILNNIKTNDELINNFPQNFTDCEFSDIYNRYYINALVEPYNDEEIIINYSDVVLQNDNITQNNMDQNDNITQNNITQNNINQNDNITQNDMIQNDNIIQNDMIQNDNVDQEYDTWEKIDKKDI